jgi:YVTN family beta-propeller protein
MRRLIYLLCALCVLMLYPATSAFAEDHTVIVLSQGDRTVYDVDATSGSVVNKIQLEGAPTEAVFSWDERSLFVSVPDQGYISVVNVATFKEVSRLTKPEFKRAANSTGFVDALATTPDYKKLYVSVPGGLEVFDQHLLIDTPNYQQPGKKISVPGADGQRMLVQGPTNKLYYAFQRDNQVAVIDTNTDTLLKTIPVKGGPMDVTFFVGGEAWVTSADGSVSIIDTNKDEVVKTIDTGGKGPGQITIAHDLRYIAATHDTSGDVTILQPVTKEVVGTLKIEKGPLSAAFAPAGLGVPLGGEGRRAASEGSQERFPTVQLYVSGQSGVSIVDLDKLTVAAPLKLGQNNVETMIHYTYPDAFTPPREGTSVRIMENDSYTLFNNAMFEYDLSPIHEHRTDMVAMVVGSGVAKLGCWDPKCPEQAISMGPSGGPYNYSSALSGDFTGVPRYTLHEEEGMTASPRRMIVFMPKTNYYRQLNPKKTSDFAGKPGFTRLAENPRAWVWNLTLVPGKPVQFPKTDYAFVYMAGGLIRETHNGVPEESNKIFSEWEVDPTEKTVEAVSNRTRVVVIEFK